MIWIYIVLILISVCLATLLLIKSLKSAREAAFLRARAIITFTVQCKISSQDRIV